ncbi:MAG: hypothetical protein JWR09_2303, partial [Mucilaginibacter sp.]|nr:hypothetical protein [Mucilaginibacter sp.]
KVSLKGVYYLDLKGNDLRDITQEKI